MKNTIFIKPEGTVSLPKIAITGAFKTGKTIISHALHLTTETPRVHSRSISEITKEFFPNKKPENLTMAELVSVGVHRYFERTDEEANHALSFISDGSVLNEWVYGICRMKLGLNPKKTLSNRIKNIWNRYNEGFTQKMAQGFGEVTRIHAIKNYDYVIHLGIDKEDQDYGVQANRFRAQFDVEMQKLLEELGIPHKVYTGSLEEKLDKILNDFDITERQPVKLLLEQGIKYTNNQVPEYNYGLT